MPRLRFTLRWMMVAVAFVAIAVWGVMSVSPYLRYLENPYRTTPGWIRAMRRKEAEEHSWKASISVGKRAAFHAAMKAKWDHAAENHLLSVAPDPPEPD